MSHPKTNDPLGYVDELYEVLQSPFMQLLLLPAGDSREPALQKLSEHLGSSAINSWLDIIGEPSEILSDEDRWNRAARLADEFLGLREDAQTVVSKLGFCKLYGISLPSDIKATLTSPLPPDLLVPAIVEVLRILQINIDDAKTLPKRFTHTNLVEDSACCAGLLYQRMNSWAVFITINDEYQQHLCKEHRLDTPFGIWMMRVLDALEILDQELQRDEQTRLLSVTSTLPLLENWRKMLAEPYRDPPPWWLDGTLEEIALQIQEEALTRETGGQSEVDSGKTLQTGDQSATLSEPPNASQCPPQSMADQRESYIRINVGLPGDRKSTDAPFSLAAQRNKLMHVGELRLPLEGELGGVLRLFPHPQKGWITLQLEDYAGPVPKLLEVNGVDVKLIKPFDEADYAVVNTQALQPVLQGQARLVLLCEAVSSGG